MLTLLFTPLSLASLDSHLDSYRGNPTLTTSKAFSDDTTTFQQSSVDRGGIGHNFKWILFREVGRINGGMSGGIIKAKYLGTEDLYAIKQVDRRSTATSKLPSYDDRWPLAKREIDTLLDLQDFPFVPRYYGMIEDAEHFNLILEWLDGWTLADIFQKYDLRHLKSHLQDQIHALIAHLIKALHDVHQRGYRHGDLKLENIMLTRTGKVMIIDWGLARPLGETSLFEVPGTISYLAPEAIARREVGSASDWWALGVVIYALLNDGQLPFEHPNTVRLVTMISTEDPEWSTALSPAEIALMQKLLYKNPLGRWGDAQYDQIRNMFTVDWNHLPTITV